jgi:hypothetical protein
MTTRTTGRAARVLGVASLAVALAACGASGGGDSAATTVKKKATTTTEKATTTTEKETTTTEEETTTTSSSSGSDATETYSDDFETDGNADNWDVGSDKKGAVGIEKGAYYTDVLAKAQFFLASDGFRDWKSASVSASTTIQSFGQGNPVAGIACLAQVGSDGSLTAWYDLGVSAEGRASIYKYTSTADPVELLAPTDIAGFDRTQPFKLDMACITRDDGSVGMAIQVDGTTAGTAADSTDPLGAGVLRVETNGDTEKLSTVYFDNWEMARYD